MAGEWLGRHAADDFCYLTTVGRRTGNPHEIEIWFAVDGGGGWGNPGGQTSRPGARVPALYMMAGGRDRSDWVRNIQANPRVTVELGDDTREGTGRILQADTAEDARARDLLVGKYATPANPLGDWGRRSLAVAIDIPARGELEGPGGQ